MRGGSRWEYIPGGEFDRVTTGDGEETVGVTVGVDDECDELLELEDDLEEEDEEDDEDDEDDVDVDLETVDILLLDDKLELLGVHKFWPFATEQRLLGGQQNVKFAHGMAVLSEHGALCHWGKR